MKYVAATLSFSTALAESQIDDVLSNSFPASDPPSWALGSAEAAPTDRALTPGALAMPARAVSDTARPGRTSETSPVRSAFRRLMALLGAVGLALLLPLFIVLLPLALLYRLMLDVTGWPERWLVRS